jgi:hypothetical protein
MDYGKRAKVVIILCCAISAVNISGCKKEEELYQQCNVAFISNTIETM